MSLSFLELEILFEQAPKESSIISGRWGPIQKLRISGKWISIYNTSTLKVIFIVAICKYANNTMCLCNHNYCCLKTYGPQVWAHRFISMISGFFTAIQTCLLKAFKHNPRVWTRRVVFLFRTWWFFVCYMFWWFFVCYMLLYFSGVLSYFLSLQE